MQKEQDLLFALMEKHTPPNMRRIKIKTYHLLFCCFFLSACGVKNPIGLEYQVHYMEVDSTKSEIFPTPSFLTINFGFRTYTYYSSWNYSLIGRWHFSGDTLVLIPQYEVEMNPQNDSIHIDYLWTMKKRNETVIAKPMKCLIKKNDIYILPNDEPFIYERDGSIYTLPPETGASGFVEPKRLSLWRKTTKGNPFRYTKR